MTHHDHTHHAGHHPHEGHPPGKEAPHHDHHAHMIADFKRRFLVSLLVTIPILLLSPMLQTLVGLRERLRFAGDEYVLLALSSFVFFYGGWPFLAGFVREMRSRRPGMMTLIALAVSVAYFYSAAVVLGLEGKVFFWELATLIDIMLLGHWVEMKSVLGASRALDEIAKLMPSDAHKVLDDGSVVDVPIAELRIGDRVLVRPGEKVPADGVVIEGESSVDEALLTGESVPVSKSAGDEVIGGAINGEGSLVVEVQKTGESSFLAQIRDLVRTAQESKSRTQLLADRAALWLTIVAIGAGGATLLWWLEFAHKDLAFALERTVTVMVITCPHALGLAIPLVVAVSTALAARHGLLIRNRTAFEAARDVDAVIFDKTGTLTRGEFGVTDTVVAGNAVGRDEMLRLAAALERNSEHPIARAIASVVETDYRVEDFKAIPGKGARGTVEGREVEVVSPGYLKERNIEVGSAAAEVERLSEQGKTVVFVIVDGVLAGAIALADQVRPESREAVRRLKERGIKCMMLTGDNRRVAAWVAEEIGLDEYFAEVLPGEKAAKVKEVKSRGLVVAMVGDGVNDAPALAEADVGIAIGAGTVVAMETADVVLVRSNPLDVVSIVELARRTYAKMVQNLAWATGYNVVAIPLAAGALYGAGVLLSPAAGAVLMSLSTVIVAVNAKRLTF